MIYFILGFITLAVWFIYGLLSDRATKAEKTSEELYDAIKDKEHIKDKLHNDPEYRKRLRDKYND